MKQKYNQALIIFFMTVCMVFVKPLETMASETEVDAYKLPITVNGQFTLDKNATLSLKSENILITWNDKVEYVKVCESGSEYPIFEKTDITNPGFDTFFKENDGQQGIITYKLQDKEEEYTIHFTTKSYSKGDSRYIPDIAYAGSFDHPSTHVSVYIDVETTSPIKTVMVDGIDETEKYEEYITSYSYNTKVSNTEYDYTFYFSGLDYAYGDHEIFFVTIDGEQIALQGEGTPTLLFGKDENAINTIEVKDVKLSNGDWATDIASATDTTGLLTYYSTKTQGISRFSIVSDWGIDSIEYQEGLSGKWVEAPVYTDAYTNPDYSTPIYIIPSSQLFGKIGDSRLFYGNVCVGDERVIHNVVTFRVTDKAGFERIFKVRPAKFNSKSVIEFDTSVSSNTSLDAADKYTTGFSYLYNQTTGLNTLPNPDNTTQYNKVFYGWYMSDDKDFTNKITSIAPTDTFNDIYLIARYVTPEEYVELTKNKQQATEQEKTTEATSTDESATEHKTTKENTTEAGAIPESSALDNNYSIACPKFSAKGKKRRIIIRTTNRSNNTVQVQVCKNKKFKKAVMVYNAKKSYITIKKTKRGKYYVRIRFASDNSQSSTWSKAKCVKVK